ncbi:MAG: aminotransferase class I/II-fold pyridoxal phosphate-dependent enzyme [Desulfobacteraceae bacterium]|nr:MAG: aminotransferase class I/II-fold pyridoxal phosphate-dependent enzyme [Desulfobacteraceae bacterium]
MKIKSKLPYIGVTIFSRMTALANECGAINLSQGFPDFDADPHLMELVYRYMQKGFNQYAPMQGVTLLRERIAEKTLKLYNATYDPATEITVTSGATEALFAAIMSVVKKGDEVIVFEPAFDCYVPAILLSGGIPKFIKMKPTFYSIDWNEVKDRISKKTKLMILNSPHNPTGSVLLKEDISSLREIVRETGILIIGDEVYEHIIFDGISHESMARYPDLASRSFVISSFGKTYHTTGWKVGYCLAPKALSAEFQKVHQFLTFSTNTPAQHAYAEFLVNENAYFGLSGFYQEKRDKLLSLLKNSRFKPVRCSGTYFQMLDYSSISDEPDMVFAKRLTTEYGVASIPPSVFYHDNDDHRVLRFCFAKKDETLEKAADKLCRI